MKKLETLLNKANISIVHNDTYHSGRFTVVELKDSRGNEVVGISRKSDNDNESVALGESIARGRAERALYSKLMHRKIQHHYMG